MPFLIVYLSIRVVKQEKLRVLNGSWVDIMDPHLSDMILSGLPQIDTPADEKTILTFYRNVSFKFDHSNNVC